jgi:hypothetical protein
MLALWGWGAAFNMGTRFGGPSLILRPVMGAAINNKTRFTGY